MKITAVLYVDKVEDSLTFWGERMGFERVAEVPEGDRLAFVILIRDGAPRRSREVTHFCSVRVTHQKCGLLIRKSIARVALSSAPKACRWINSHEHTRYAEFTNMRRARQPNASVKPRLRFQVRIFLPTLKEARSLSTGRKWPRRRWGWTGPHF